ncbi:DUF4386 family protein [Petropleomorpha daqingensis]|uniref:DUF4386 family protein n=1 Tax=Petropleomorpha daqingensis TaxID=2026353 RepID=A0A853CFB2_9ACTN|nr:DUF4386 family protein [Petropleomorpha daqingensis]NYJ05262.1 hypothetical protein [Petropleomorpha daqingensis]
MTLPTPRTTGTLLIGAAVLANAAFVGLSSVFGYPDVLQLPAQEALARFAEQAPLVPALFVVLAAAAALLAPVALGLSRLGAGRWRRVVLAAGVGAALVQVVGLLRWPLLVPGLAATATDPSASVAARAAAGDRFETLGTVLGQVVGESGGYLLTAVFTVAVVLALRERFRLSRLQVVLGLGSVPLVLVGLLVPLGVPGADAANFAGYVVWTAWCIVLGVRLVRTGEPGRPLGTEAPALSELHA